MTVRERFAVLLDGEFLKKTLSRRLRRFPQSDDIMAEVDRVCSPDLVTGLTLYRVFYYTADPLEGTTRHPLTGDQDYRVIERQEAGLGIRRGVRRGVEPG